VGQEQPLVSELFCDLVGFTARADHADPDDVANLLRPTTPNCAIRSSASPAPWTSSSATAPWPSSTPRSPTRTTPNAPSAARWDPGRIDQLNQAHQGLELAVRVG
jgi:hypothetical protein